MGCLFSLVMDWAFLFRCIMDMLMRERLGLSLLLGRGGLLLRWEAGVVEAWPKLLLARACGVVTATWGGCLGLASWSSLDMETALPVLGVDDLEEAVGCWTPESAMLWVMVGMRSVRRLAAEGPGVAAYIDCVMPLSSPKRDEHRACKRSALDEKSNQTGGGCGEEKETSGTAKSSEWIQKLPPDIVTKVGRRFKVSLGNENQTQEKRARTLTVEQLRTSIMGAA